MPKGQFEIEGPTVAVPVEKPVAGNEPEAASKRKVIDQPELMNVGHDERDIGVNYHGHQEGRRPWIPKQPGDGGQEADRNANEQDGGSPWLGFFRSLLFLPTGQYGG